MKDAIIEIIKWVRESLRPLVVLLALSLLVLGFPLLPERLTSSFAAADALAKYRLPALLVLVGATVWLLSFPIERRFQLTRRKTKLRTLTDDERNVLGAFIRNRRRTQCLGRLHAPVGHSLVRAGILTQLPSHDGVGNPYFEIEPWAYAHLLRNPNLLKVDE